MSVSDEERRDAEKTGELVSKKLMEIMDLQADIDALLRDKHPTPFGSKNWRYACIEALQRIVAMTAIQFVLFEPEGRVKGKGFGFITLANGKDLFFHSSVVQGVSFEASPISPPPSPKKSSERS